MQNTGASRPPRSTKTVNLSYPYTQDFLAERTGKILRAEWGPRCAALLLDFIGFSLIFNLIGQNTWLRLRIGQVSDDSVAGNFVFYIPPEIHNLAWWLLFGLYATLTTQWFGATLGKRWLNLEVATTDGMDKPNFLKLYGRYTLGYGLSALIFMGGFILAIFDKDKEALHDKIFKTSVIVADPTQLDRWY